MKMYSFYDMQLLLVNDSHTAFIEALQSFDIKSFDKFGNNILHYFIKLCSNSKSPISCIEWKSIIASLFKAGIDIEEKQKNMNSYSPLHLAVSLKRKEIAEFLLSCGADINSIDNFGKPIIVTAMLGVDEEKAYQMVSLLVNNGADLNYILPSTNQTVKEFALSSENRDFQEIIMKQLGNND